MKHTGGVQNVTQIQCKKTKARISKVTQYAKQNITDEYSCGVYNGLELALAVLEEREPEFVFVEKKEEPKQMEKTKQKGRTVASGVRKLGG